MVLHCSAFAFRYTTNRPQSYHRKSIQLDVLEFRYHRWQSTKILYERITVSYDSRYLHYRYLSPFRGLPKRARTRPARFMTGRSLSGCLQARCISDSLSIAILAPHASRDPTIQTSHRATTPFSSCPSLTCVQMARFLNDPLAVIASGNVDQSTHT
jgi:hypothetical protein